MTRDYPSLAGPEDFAAWSEPGTVRVLFAHWVEPGEDGTAELVSEARVAPTDAPPRCACARCGRWSARSSAWWAPRGWRRPPSGRSAG